MDKKLIKSSKDIQVWGTVVWAEAFGNSESELEAGIDGVIDYFTSIDAKFSPYVKFSDISQLRAGTKDISACHADVQEVWNLCLKAKELTEGAFDPWCVEGGFDPSGYVKGWAADKGVAILKKHGATSIQINAAGDISVAGGFNGGPWNIGIRHPEDARTIVKVFEISDGSIATSGTYERGAHIYDPHTGMIAIGARSATVIGPNGGLADALATALVVAGKDGARWFTKPELAEYSAWVIERHSDQAWGINLK